MRSELFWGSALRKFAEELRYKVQCSVIYSSMIFVTFLKGAGTDFIIYFLISTNLMH